MRSELGAAIDRRLAELIITKLRRERPLLKLMPTSWVCPIVAPAARRLRRDYLLLAGSLAAALQIGCWLSADWFDPQSPNLFWPADRAWCVATEIDFDSTLLGGTTELIEAVLEAPTLDSWPVRPDDSLAFDADQINPVP
jgi:hypothetical protein